MTGFGVMTWSSGKKYEGTLWHGWFHGVDESEPGNGILTEPVNKDGVLSTEYKGTFLEGKKSGQGILKKKFEDGHVETYRGEFENDLEHGPGQWTHSESKGWEGKWVDGMRGNGEETKQMTWMAATFRAGILARVGTEQAKLDEILKTLSDQT